MKTASGKQVFRSCFKRIVKERVEKGRDWEGTTGGIQSEINKELKKMK